MGAQSQDYILFGLTLRSQIINFQFCNWSLFLNWVVWLVLFDLNESFQYISVPTRKQIETAFINRMWTKIQRPVPIVINLSEQIGIIKLWSKIEKVINLLRVLRATNREINYSFLFSNKSFWIKIYGTPKTVIVLTLWESQIEEWKHAFSSH